MPSLFPTRHLLGLRSLPRNQSRWFSFSHQLRFPRIPEPRTPGASPDYPSFRGAVARANTIKSFSEEVKHPSIRNQIAVSFSVCRKSCFALSSLTSFFQFFLFGSFVVYSLAAKQTNNDTAYWTKRLCESGNLLFKVRPPTSEEMRRARYYDLGKVRL